MKRTYCIPTTAEELLIAETRLMQEESQSAMPGPPPTPPMAPTRSL